MLADMTRLAPALSPTRHTFSPVQPATDSLNVVTCYIHGPYWTFEIQGYSRLFKGI